MRMVVTAAKATVYGKAMVAGDEFDCSDKEAKLWEALARAKAAAASGEPAGDLLGGEGAETVGRRRRGYNRRDMRAED